MRSWLVASLLALMGVGPGGAMQAFAQRDAVEVIPLRYRTVEQVIPVLKPLLDRDGTISGMNSSLIVRTSPGNLADIRRVLEQIDARPRQLRITVRQDADMNQSGSGAELSGEIRSGNAGVVVPGRGDPRGATVEVRGADGAIRGRVYSTQSAENDRMSQQIQVLEGNEAFIHVGQSVPVPNRTVVRSVVNGRVVEQAVVDTTQFRDHLSGFHVRPRVSGDIVTLEISPQRDTPGRQGPGSANVQRLVTTVSGRLGDWIELGGVDSGTTVDRGGTVYRTQSATADNRRVLLRVEEVR
jgi:type II secretory pathway component GspD/PulD (secretin)